MYLKFPPLFGIDKTLLIESDNAFRDPDIREILGRKGTEGFISGVRDLLGTPAEFSLLVVSEIPQFPEAITPIITNTLDRWLKAKTAFVQEIPSEQAFIREGRSHLPERY